MIGVEFQTVVRNGMIEIPSEYRVSFKDRVRVILLVEEPAKVTSHKTPRPFGLCAGDFVVPDEFNAPLPEEILRQFEGS